MNKIELNHNLNDLDIDIIDEPIEGNLIKIDKTKQLLLFSVSASAIEGRTELLISTMKGTDFHVYNKKFMNEIGKFNENEEAYMLCGTDAEGRLEVKALFDSSIYSLLHEKQLSTLEWLFSLEEGARESILKRFEFNNRYPEAKVFTKTKLNLDDLKKTYEIFKTCFDPQQQAYIHSLFEEAETPMNFDKKQQVLEKLSIIFNCSGGIPSEKVEKMKPSELRKAISENFFGQEEAVDEVVSAIVSGSYSKEGSGRIFGLFGEPGTGKSALAKVVASVIDKPFFEQSLEGVTHQSELSGTDSSFFHSKAGSIVLNKKEFPEGCVMLFDEIDKALCSSNNNSNENSNGDIKNYVSSIIGDKKISDSYIGSYVYCNQDYVFFTGNSADNLPEHVKNRLRIVNFKAYSIHEKCQILQRHIIPKLMNSHNVDTENIIFKEPILTYICQYYTADLGMRKAEEAVKIIFDHILNTWKEEGKASRIVVTKEFVDSVLKDKIDSSSPIYTYQKNKDFYPNDIKIDIEKTIASLNRTDLSYEDREILNKKLEVLSKLFIVPSEGKRTFNKNLFEKNLSEFIGLEKTKQVVAEIFNFDTYLDDVFIKPKLFIGTNGVGKTSFAEAVAKASGRNLLTIECSTVRDIDDIIGLPSSFKGLPKVGFIEKIQSLQNNVILINEIDKLPYVEGKYTGNPLIELLNRGRIRNQFIQHDIDFPKNTIFILTTNDISKIPNVILDRCEKINFSTYTRKERKDILERYLKRLGEKFKRKIKIEPAAIELIATTYQETPSVRELQTNAEKIVRKALMDLNTKELNITCNLVENTLGLAPVLKISPDGMYPGSSIGLAVTAAGSGTAFVIESALFDSNNEGLLITGLAKESVMESCKITHTLLRKRFDQLNDKSLHIHFQKAGIEKNGPSAGVSIYMSVLSLFKHTTIKEVAFTGELGLHGGIFPVGGINEKVQAAINAGCKTVFLPKGNEHDINIEDFPEIKIIFASNVSEIEYIIFEKH